MKSVISILTIAVSLWVCGYIKEDKDLDDKIGIILDETKKQIHDMDNDGCIDCVDWSILFHYLWSHRYTEKIDLAINKNPAKKMHHMFVYIYKNGKTYHVEPQMYNWCYIMESCWWDTYDPDYDTITDYVYWYRSAGLCGKVNQTL